MGTGWRGTLAGPGRQAGQKLRQLPWRCAPKHGRRGRPLPGLGWAQRRSRQPAWPHQRLPPATQQAPALAPDHADALALAAYLGLQSRGQPLAPPDDARLAPLRQQGQALWQQRLGQLNLACLHCHDQRAGQKLGGAAIPQGHATGYPSYRLEWQGLGSLQRRLRGCVVGVRAEPWAPDAPEWLALEAWLAQRAAGMAVETPAVRP